ncbi:MAG: hydroxyphenylacetyl-CoA thioesterase PaaI [Sporichthyaceae bacterium]
MSDPDKVADAVVHAMLDTDRASNSLGITLVRTAPGDVTVELVLAERHMNGHGSCHGGVMFTLADTAFGLACNSFGPPAVAAAADIVFARPARVGERLEARAIERTSFGRSGVYDVTIRSGDTVVAEFRGRSRVVGTEQPGSDGVRP